MDTSDALSVIRDSHNYRVSHATASGGIVGRHDQSSLPCETKSMADIRVSFGCSRLQVSGHQDHAVRFGRINGQENGGGNIGVVVVATWKESTSVVERHGNCLLRVGARYLLPESCMTYADSI